MGCFFADYSNNFSFGKTSKYPLVNVTPNCKAPGHQFKVNEKERVVAGGWRNGYSGCHK